MSRISCSEAQSKLKNIALLKDQFFQALEQVHTSISPREARVALTQAQELKEKLEKEVNEFSPEFGISQEQAREIMGEDFYGKERIKAAFGFELNDADIPEIPYTKEKIEWAKKEGMMLMLFLDRDHEGNPFTPKRIGEIFESTSKDVGDRNFFAYDTNIRHVSQQDFFTTETAPRRWRLVAKKMVAHSYQKNYIQQTKELRNILDTWGVLTDKERAESSEEELQKIELRANLYLDQAAHELMRLAINQNHRLSVVEELQRIALILRAEEEIMQAQEHGLREDQEILQRNSFVWTKTLIASSSTFASVGDFFPLDIDDLRTNGIYIEWDGHLIYGPDNGGLCITI